MAIIETPQVRLGHFLRDARESTGLSQTDFGQRLGGVSQTRVSRWERGKDYPDVMQMRAIADLTGHDYLCDLRSLPNACIAA